MQNSVAMEAHGKGSLMRQTAACGLTVRVTAATGPEFRVNILLLVSHDLNESTGTQARNGPSEVRPATVTFGLCWPGPRRRGRMPQAFKYSTVQARPDRT